MTEKQIIAWIKCALMTSHGAFRQLGPAILWLKAQEEKASPGPFTVGRLAESQVAQEEKAND